MTKKLACILIASLMILSTSVAFAQGESWVENEERNSGDSLIAHWDFESDPIDAGWRFVDADGDGYNWEAFYSSYYSNSGDNCIRSYSYLNNNVYDPDNWAITPAVNVPEGNTALTFWGRNRSATGTDIFRVYAGTSQDPEAMEPIASSMAFSGAAYEMKSIDVSSFAGQTVYFAFRHANSRDQYMLFIDDVSVVNGVAPATSAPENLLYGCYFEDDEDVEDWRFVSADGDSYGWERYYMPKNTHSGVGLIGSQSLVTGVGSVTPDNWIISPAISLPNEALSLTFYARGKATTDAYVEHFTVYASTSPELDDLMQNIIIPETVTQNEYICYTADLSMFANRTVYIAIRHHNCTGLNILMLDDFEVWGSGAYLPSEPGSILHGDVDLNANVEVADSLLLMRYLISSEPLNDEQLVMAEVDCTGFIDIKDALLIMRFALGTIHSLPAQLQ